MQLGYLRVGKGVSSWGVSKRNFMDKHYQEIVDEVFGSYYPHRTLRTLFDLHSSEWNETTVDEKLGILKRILSTNKISLSKLIVGYKHFYTKELFE